MDWDTTFIKNGRDWQQSGSYVQYVVSAITVMGAVPIGVGINRFSAAIGIAGAGMESYGSGNYCIVAKSSISFGASLFVNKLGDTNKHMSEWQAAVNGDMWGYMTGTTLSRID
ncbi:hypothetical protein R3X28_10675 [Maribacter sp. TH_r10]|uniref:hypothetical protein n=1 Tax=Maribacter TaxID=252356 RepID=UPI00248F82D1|nr:MULTISPECIES: hypothetical protein [Maribacter]MDV7139343.1 hypothetical protein [Maribacter sp. TH_r10]